MNTNHGRDKTLVEHLQHQLKRSREEWLTASRHGDVIKVGQLTLETARINRELQHLLNVPQ